LTATAPGWDQVSESRRHEQKLWLILFQIKGVRARLNFLALQHWLFSTTALLIGAAGLTFLAAATFGPMTFLGLAIFLTLAAIAGIVRETRVAHAMRASAARAASIADERSQMKGRLTTVLALAETQRRSSLWAYLVEDTYGRRDDYAPARIEPRLISRAVLPLLASILLAVLTLPFARFSHTRRRLAPPTGAGAPGQITADIKSLDIRPADPALQPNAEIYADPDTLRKLADKLASAENFDRNGGRGLSKLLNKARDFADSFQDKLTGRNRKAGRPMQLRLTDSTPGRSAKPNRGTGNSSNNGGKKGDGKGLANNSQPGASGPGQPQATQKSQPPITSLPAQQADQLAANNAARPAPGPGQAQDGAGGSPDSGGSGNASAGDTSNHGSGSQPANLFGPESAQPLGSDSFKIAIEAEPTDEASSPGSPAYIPPKIRVPLNSNQYPDQPLARATVPADDENTIKRVFER
jgi:hypothetical protein